MRPTQLRSANRSAFHERDGRCELYPDHMKRLTLVAVLALAACSSPVAATPSVTPTPTAPTSAVAKKYAAIEDLRDDAGRAGYYCANWQQTNRVQVAVASGTCDDASVFMLFLTEADVSQNVQALKSTKSPIHLLVGPNWILNVPQPESLQARMGGIVVRRA